jgi:hypothetical protein
MFDQTEKIRSVYYSVSAGALLASALWAVFSLYEHHREEHDAEYHYGTPVIHINAEQIWLPNDDGLYVATTVVLENKGDRAVNLNLPADFLTLLKVMINNDDKMEWGKKYSRTVPFEATEYVIREGGSETFSFVNKVDTTGLYYASVFSPLQVKQEDIIKITHGSTDAEFSWRAWNYIVVK